MPAVMCIHIYTHDDSVAIDRYELYSYVPLIGLHSVVCHTYDDW